MSVWQQAYCTRQRVKLFSIAQFKQETEHVFGYQIKTITKTIEMFHLISINHQVLRASRHTWLLIEFYLRHELAIERILTSCATVRRFCMNMKSASRPTCLTGCTCVFKKKCFRCTCTWYYIFNWLSLTNVINVCRQEFICSRQPSTQLVCDC